jgi:hypothetical protein
MFKLLLALFLTILFATSCAPSAEETAAEINVSPQQETTPEPAQIEKTPTEESIPLQTPEITATPTEHPTENPEETIRTENIHKIYDLVSQEVPELDAFADWIDEKSEGKAHLTMRSDGIATDVMGNFPGLYHMVYVGEQHEDHSANWAWFLVNEDIDEVFWYDVVECEIFSLEEWRGHPRYHYYLFEDIPELG